MIKDSYQKNIFLTLFSILIFIIIPFSLTSTGDDISAQIINEESVGFYQSSTCKISLSQVLVKNFSNINKIYVNNNPYPGLKCFGKVTGLDVVNETYILSIGTNPNLTFLLQIFLWLSLLFIFSKKRESKLNLSFYPPIFIPALFTSQHYFESRFYKNSNFYFNENLQFPNYYFLTFFLGFLFFTFLLRDIYERRNISITGMLPFIFIFNGTFQGLNINIYLVALSYFGIEAIFSKKTNSIYNMLYFIFTVLWIFNFEQSSNYFDGDKLIGFINTSENLGSLIFWILIFYLITNGILFLVKNEKIKVSLKDIKNNFLIAGSLVVFFGLMGSASAYINFFNFFIFGQNKRGMRDLNSVAGNAWRGFAPSAEFIGEFFAICILITVFYFIKTRDRATIQDLLSIVCLFGLYKSNNFAAIVSLIMLTSVIIFYEKIKINKKLLIAILLVIFIVTPFIFQALDYERYSSALVEESILHSNLFQYDDPFKNDFTKKSYFLNKDYKSILLVDSNHERASSTLKIIVDLYSQNINVPLVPNPISVLSTVSLFINRTEMWGIFIAKHNPNLQQSLFGYGPFQIVDYLNGHKVELDVPSYKSTALFLPHSSILDGILFFGIIGVIILILFYLYFVYKKRIKENLFLFISIFYIINLLKSDSILYISCFVLFTVSILKSFELKKYD
jgi:hypothetical protein